jgi:uncharacterized protein YndB with AHSA1/START domain
MGTPGTQEWQLNNVAEVFVDASVERLWAALTEPTDTEQYFMGSRVPAPFLNAGRTGWAMITRNLKDYLG